jgi:general secretion pathway protein C
MTSVGTALALSQGKAEGTSAMSFHRGLRRYFKATLVAPIGAIVLLSAQGVAQLTHVALGSGQREIALRAAMQPLPRHADPPFHTTSANPILDRNPFDSTVSSGPLFIYDGQRPEDDPDPQHAPACDGVKVLAIVGSSDPDFSFAAFEDRAAPGHVLRRRGGGVGERTVAFIGWDRVWLGTGGHLCQAAMFAPEPPADARPMVPAQPVVGGAGVPLDPTIANGIEKVSATSFRVDRAIVPRILEHQADLARPQTVMERSGGKVTGLRLSGVQPESLLGVLGIQSGDLLSSINGVDVSNTSALLEMYARLPQLDHLTAQVVRGGAAVRLDYDVR